MNRTKDKYFELLVREEAMVKYYIRANDQQQAERIFEQHSDYLKDNHREVASEDKHIIEIGEHNDPF
jgi:hypothetical protein